MRQTNQVVEARADQVETIAKAMARGFVVEPMMTYVVGDAPDAYLRLEGLFKGGLRLAFATGVVYVPRGEPVGAAMGWPLPSSELHPDVAATIEPPEAALGPEAAARFSEVVEHVEGHLTRLVSPPVWYLPALGVDPAFQGSGVGSALLQAFLSRAAADRVPACWATWTEPNVAFYLRRGGHVVGEGVLPGTEQRYWLFRWEEFVR